MPNMKQNPDSPFDVPPAQRSFGPGPGPGPAPMLTRQQQENLDNSNKITCIEYNLRQCATGASPQDASFRKQYVELDKLKGPVAASNHPGLQNKYAKVCQFALDIKNNRAKEVQSYLQQNPQDTPKSPKI